MFAIYDHPVHLTCHSLPLDLSKRIEYVTLALSNGKSHAASEYSRHESAVEFLKDVEEQLEVANVQLEIHREVRGLMARSGELSPLENLLSATWGGLDRLESNLLTISEVCTSSLAVAINLMLLDFPVV